MFYDILLVGRSSSTLWYDVLASTIAVRSKGPLLSVIYILPCVQSLPLPSTQESIPTTWRSISAPSINTNFNTNLNINNNHNLILPHGDFRTSHRLLKPSLTVSAQLLIGAGQHPSLHTLSSTNTTRHSPMNNIYHHPRKSGLCKASPSFLKPSVRSYASSGSR